LKARLTGKNLTTFFLPFGSVSELMVSSCPKEQREISARNRKNAEVFMVVSYINSSFKFRQKLSYFQE
jgi:hypothetical protein